MILDLQNLFSNDQAVTDTAASTNVIDLGAPTTNVRHKVPVPNIKGGDINLLVQVTEDFATCDSVAIAFQTDTAEDFGSAVTLFTQTILVADLVAGKKFALGKLPSNLSRYIRLYYTVAGSTATAGKITAGLTACEEVNL